MTRVPLQPRPDRGSTRTRAAKPALALAALSLWLAPPASADIGATIIERCAQGKSISGYTQQDYRRALQELPTEVEEYSECGNVIRRAELAAAGAGGSATGPGTITPTPLTPAEQRGLAAIAHTPAPALRVGGRLVRPGIVHAGISSAFSSLPNALLAVLSLIVAAALALAGRTMRNRVWKRSSG